MKLARRQLLGFGLALPAIPALAETAWPTTLVMGTGRHGGDYMIYGPAWGAHPAKNGHQHRLPRLGRCGGEYFIDR